MWENFARTRRSRGMYCACALAVDASSVVANGERQNEWT